MLSLKKFSPYGAMAKWFGRWIPNTGFPGLKPLGCSKVDRAFHLSEAGQVNTGNSWTLSGQK